LSVGRYHPHGEHNHGAGQHRTPSRRNTHVTILHASASKSPIHSRDASTGFSGGAKQNQRGAPASGSGGQHTRYRWRDRARSQRIARTARTTGTTGVCTSFETSATPPASDPDRPAVSNSPGRTRKNRGH
jgi:hypothetical protein